MKDRLYQFIRDVTLIDPEHLRALRDSAERRTLKKGEVLLAEGIVCNEYYFVESGFLRTTYNKEGVIINVNFTFEGSFVSNLKSLKTNSPSELTIDAGEASTILVFHRSLLSSPSETTPEVLLFSRRLMTVLVVALEEHSQLFKTHTPAERYAWLEKNNPRLLQRVSLSQLASYMGVTRETLSRIRKKK